MTTIKTMSIKKYAKENNLRIVEATRNLRLRLTRADVQTGVSRNPANCGFARACTRSNRVDRAFFLRSTAFLQKGNRLVRYILPESMKAEIVAFDRGGRMEPGVYNLLKASPSATVEAQRRRVAPKGPNSVSGPRHRVTGIRTGIVIAA